MLIRRLATAFIRLYRLCISPFLGQNCRFYPSCSHYAEEAISQHGLGKGVYLSARRLGRCHPFNPGGYDPVPGTQMIPSTLPNKDPQQAR